jgi:hypothetical protein
MDAREKLIEPGPFEFDDFDDEEDEFDCHMRPDGYCGAAGSEDCEFDCPNRWEQRRAAMDEKQP